MRKFLFTAFISVTLLLAGCFETTQEITLNDDGSGTLISTNDMSAVIPLVKQMGGKDAEKMDDETLDSTIELSSKADSIENLTPEEKELLKKGTLHMNMNLKEDKFLTTTKFSFASLAEMEKCNLLTAKIMTDALKGQLADIPGMGDMPATSSFDDYFKTSFSKGVLVKTLNKEKYADVEKDEYLKSMRETSGMGIPVSSSYIINLPRPAKKAEGKNVKLSADKKTVTIKADIDDFFDDPAKMEFRIEY